MDQIKIGKFIAGLRKEQNKTQQDLASELGVTDRAISKWENGRGLPDISFLKPLSDALGISVNELLSGERIEKEEIIKKTEETLIDSLTHSKKKMQKIKWIFAVILSVILLVILLLSSFFCVDIIRMREGEEVIFGTWGFDYAPPINLSEEKIEYAIKEYLVSEGDGEPAHYEGEKTFAAFRPYLLEETEAQKKYTVYAWVLVERIYEENGELKQDSGYSIPHKFEIERRGDSYAVIGADIPRDGSYYTKDLKSLFPYSVRIDMEKVHTDGTYARLKMEIDEQAQLYFHK